VNKYEVILGLQQWKLFHAFNCGIQTDICANYFSLDLRRLNSKDVVQIGVLSAQTISLLIYAELINKLRTELGVSKYTGLQ
jgi:hypothetical protein